VPKPSLDLAQILTEVRQLAPNVQKLYVFRTDHVECLEPLDNYHSLGDYFATSPTLRYLSLMYWKNIPSTVVRGIGGGKLLKEVIFQGCTVNAEALKCAKTLTNNTTHTLKCDVPELWGMFPGVTKLEVGDVPAHNFAAIVEWYSRSQPQ